MKEKSLRRQHKETLGRIHFVKELKHTNEIAQQPISGKQLAKLGYQQAGNLISSFSRRSAWPSKEK